MIGVVLGVSVSVDDDASAALRRSPTNARGLESSTRGG